MLYRSIRFGSWGSILAIIFVVALMCGQCGAAEMRSFWVDAWGAGAMSQAEVDNLLGVVGNPSSTGEIRDANCNAILLQVRRNCDANYPSSMGEPYMSGLTPANFNALQAVINAAHDTTGGKKRIEVHAWVVAFRTSGGTVYLNHDDTPTGSLTTLDNYWPSRDNTGAVVSDKAFDPGHPLAEQYTVDVAMDLVNNFDIDGIHFDYIRFTANNQGYNPTSVARYNARYGLTGNPSSTDEQWKQWRRDQVTNVVRKVYALTQSSKPWVKVSGSFVTWDPAPTASTRAAFQATRPYYDVYSDWDSWLQEGIVDAAMPMTYYDYLSPTSWTKWINWEKDRHGNRHMYIGPGLYKNFLPDVITEILETRTPSPAGNRADGFCGYSYRSAYAINKDTNTYGPFSGLAPQLLSQVTQTWDDIPDMPWKSSPSTVHISGTVTYSSNGKWADGATVSITGPVSRSMYVDGTGFYAFIDVPPGIYTVTASKTGYPDYVKYVSTAVGSVTGNMYTVNFGIGSTTPPPAISNVGTDGVYGEAAGIVWNTDQPASSQVEYGLTTSYGSITPVDPTLVFSHTVALNGLTSGTTYHYRVISSNSFGTSTSSDYTFSTQGPPSISGIAVTNVTSTSATVTWTTSTLADSRVNYGLTSSYGSQSTDAEPVYSHSITLTGLTPSTTYHYQCVSANDYGTRSSTDLTFTTASLPTITGVTATNIGANIATITWTTNQAADSRVDYGTTTTYGIHQANSSLLTSHSVTLSNLLPSTLYHYKCTSTNANGTAVSADYTFTTGSVPAEIVIDDTSATMTGTWTRVTGSGYSSDYYWSYCRRTSQTGACTWTPNITTAGNYDVYCMYAGTTTPTANATFTVNYNGGSASRSFNQANNQNTWNLIASNLPFAVGTGGTIVLGNLTGESNSTKRVVADAVRLVYVASPQSQDVIVDDADPGAEGTGTWYEGTVGAETAYNGTYKYADTNPVGAAEYTWTPTIPTTGKYNLYCWYTSGSNRTHAADYEIHYAGGTRNVTIDQTTGGGGWVPLATMVHFDRGTAGYVKLNSGPYGFMVVADALKWEYAGDASDIPPMVSISAPSVPASKFGPVSYTVNYSDDYGISAVTLTAADIILNKTGTANGTVTVSGTGNATRTVTISNVSGDGDLSISLAAGTASDTTGQLAPAVGPSSTFAADNTPPSISIGTPSATQTKTGPVTYTISYGGASNITLTWSNITLHKTGTANGNATVSGTGNTSRTITVSGCSGEGTLGISIAAGTATDLAGNSAPAAGPSATFNVDYVAPTVSISAPSAAQTSGGPITYTITYGGADTVTLANANVSLNKTGTANGTVAVSGTGTTTRTVTISGITGDGTLGISIAAGTARDTIGNTAAAAGPSATFTVDNTAPTISIGDPSATQSSGSPVTYTVSYTGADSVTLAPGDVTLNKTGTADGTVAVSGTGTSTRTITISSITGAGTLGISIAAGTASDNVGHTVPAAGPSATFTVDNAAPTISIGSPSATQTSSGPISYTVTYAGADSISLEADDVALNRTGTADGTIAVTGSGTVERTITISSITGTGTLGISVAAGTASRSTGATAAAAGPSETFTVDNSPAVMATVNDETYTISTVHLVGSWTAADAESGIARYEYAVGTDPVSAPNDKRDWTSAGPATQIDISDLSLTVGETYYISARAVNGVGITSAPMASSGVKICYPVDTVLAAKAIEDGKPVGMPMTFGAYPQYVISARFPDCFYIEDINRLAGIRVDYPGSDLIPGYTVRVFGILGTSDGERAILSPKVIYPSMLTTVQPFSMVNAYIGGFDLGFTPGVTAGRGVNTTGLLVRIAGKVTGHIDSNGFYVDNGASPANDSPFAGIKVVTGPLSREYDGSNVVVTGVVSCYKVGSTVYPQILASSFVEY